MRLRTPVLTILVSVRLTAMAHPGDEALESLARGTLATAESLRLQTHIFHCPDCLQRLIKVEMLLMLEDAFAEPRHALKPDMRRPLFIRHDTADGFIYWRVEKRAGSGLRGIGETSWRANRSA